MKPFLERLLACPECHGPLHTECTARNGEEVIAGTLDCRECRLRFPIRDGIPRFVSSDAYVASFSFEWKRWRRTQFDTAARQTSESTFQASTGKLAGGLAGKLVLDAGCGPGRYLDLVARSGAQVVGVDLSLAIDVARENFQNDPNVHLLQADLLRLPFPPRTFDFVFSIGVLHHTRNTREAFLRLVKVTKPGGEVALWVYPLRRLTETFRFFPDRVNEVLAQDVNFRIPSRGAGIVRRLAPLLDGIMESSSRMERTITTRLPTRWLYALCHLAIPLYYIYRVPLFYPLRLVTKIAMDPDPEWRVLDTFDWYSPQYQWKHTYPQVRRWFEEAGLEEISLLPRPVAVRGKKPAP